MKTKKSSKISRKGFTALTLRERTIIEVRWREGKNITAIAEELKRNKSTISRETKGKRRRGSGGYRADIEQGKALDRIEKRGNTEKVRKGCEDLRPYLARRHTRRATKGMRKVQKAERREALPSIEMRPAAVNDRSRVGDWEDDLVVSRASKPCVKSVNERKTGVVFFGKSASGTAIDADSVLFKKLAVIPPEYRKTLTRDRGSENRSWREAESVLGLSVYFAHAYHSWERGSNENANGLLRRFFPKKTDWDMISDTQIARAEYLINTRPRKRFGGLTPAEVFYQETGVALFC